MHSPTVPGLTNEHDSHVRPFAVSLSSSVLFSPLEGPQNEPEGLLDPVGRQSVGVHVLREDSQGSRRATDLEQCQQMIL